MVDYILKLARDSLMTRQGAILIEERIYPPALFIRLNEVDQKADAFVSCTRKLFLYVFYLKMR